jgi:hypothetical protein
MSYTSRTTREHKTPESNKSECQKHRHFSCQVTQRGGERKFLPTCVLCSLIRSKHRVGHCGVFHMTVESMGGSAHTQIGHSADVETAQSMYPFITSGHAKTAGESHGPRLPSRPLVTRQDHVGGPRMRLASSVEVLWRAAEAARVADAMIMAKKTLNL